MSIHVTKRVVTFTGAFTLDPSGPRHPGGKYVVETREEFVQGRDIAAFLRVSTTLRPDERALVGQGNSWTICPKSLEVALVRDGG